MDVTTILRDLRTEYELISKAIAALERIGSHEKRRGRPPKWLLDAIDTKLGSRSESGAQSAEPRKRGRPRKTA